MVNWVEFFQTPNDTVKFITNEDSNNPQVLSYKKFVLYIGQFKALDRVELNNALDRFQTVFLDCSTGKWEIQKPELKAGTFEQMLKLNPEFKVKTPEEEKEEKNREPLQRKKNFLDLFYSHRKDQSLSNTKEENKKVKLTPIQKIVKGIVGR